MKKTVYLVRHGESTENVRSSPVYQGGSAELTELGISQAHAIAARAAHLPAQAMIASPFRRAAHTAEIISARTGLPLETSELFTEHLTPSSFEGREWSDELRSDFRVWYESMFNPGLKHLDGENFDEIKTRAARALDMLRDHPAERLLVVSHGFFIRTMAALVMLGESFAPEHLKRLNHTLITRNTGITVFAIGTADDRKDQNSWHMLTWNDHAHLG